MDDSTPLISMNSDSSSDLDALQPHIGGGGWQSQGWRGRGKRHGKRRRFARRRVEELRADVVLVDTIDLVVYLQLL